MTGLEATTALLAGFAATAVAAVAARLVRGWRQRPAVPRPAPVSRSTLAPGGAPMTRDAHWQRAADVVVAAGEQTETMRRLQKSASAHLDAADYALQQLMAELTPVMPVAARQRTSNVHQLPQAASRGGTSRAKAEAA